MRDSGPPRLTSLSKAALNPGRGFWSTSGLMLALDKLKPPRTIRPLWAKLSGHRVSSSAAVGIMCFIAPPWTLLHHHVEAAEAIGPANRGLISEVPVGQQVIELRGYAESQ